MNQPEPLELSEAAAFEHQLIQAIRQVDPPAGFAERILAEAAARAHPERIGPVTMPRPGRLWFGSAIAATLLAGFFGAQQLHLRHQRDETAEVQRQFEAGLRITGDALEQTRQQLQQFGISLGH